MSKIRKSFYRLPLNCFYHLLRLHKFGKHLGTWRRKHIEEEFRAILQKCKFLRWLFDLPATIPAPKPTMSDFFFFFLFFSLHVLVSEVQSITDLRKGKRLLYSGPEPERLQPGRWMSEIANQIANANTVHYGLLG